VPIIDLPKRVASILQILKVDLLLSWDFLIFIQLWRRQIYFKFDICFKKEKTINLVYCKNQEFNENSLINFGFLFLHNLERYRRNIDR